jgi:arginyl-tRNA synthetase
LGGELKRSPFAIAEDIVTQIKKLPPWPALSSIIEDIKIEKPAFINFYLSNKAVINVLKEILAEGQRFGSLNFGKGRKAQIEFVSANPTGPLTVAHGRQAAVGDSLARIFEHCGYKVMREYYINDEGVQMDLLAKSVKARFLDILGEGSNFPENGYKGGYIYDIARDIHKLPRIKKRIATNKRFEDNFLSEDFFMDYASKWIMQTIKKDMEDFGVRFDRWYSQKRLSRSGKIENALSILKEKDFLYEKDAATWFRSSEFGDDKDRVVIKNDGAYTYLTPDIAYHKEKFENGYERIINIWGPDHHGYINRVKAACQALGFDKDKLSILICQLVTLYRDKKPVRMSTREGEFITLRQVIDEVGRDASRFFFMMRRTDSHLDFDLELAKSKTMDNPIYYIQYAHARISSVINFSGNIKTDVKNLEFLEKSEEIDIIKALMQYPRIIVSSLKNLEPYILVSYLQDLATSFHSYYDSHRIVTDDSALTNARIALVRAINRVLFSGLSLLGVAAPEKM